MTLRAMAFAFIGVIGATAVAAADGSAWHAVAKAPRGALPDVQVTLGYPGPYIPTWNSPLVLRTAAHPNFTGHIGFRFAVGDNATRDLAVLSADRVERDKPWSFTTWARLKSGGWRAEGPSFNRELVIEWRSSDMKIIGKRSVGVPPWSVARPLLISQSAAPAIRLGLEPFVADPAQLPAVAQWYAGFSATIVALDLWLDLPAPVREAIVGSPARIVFVGFPRAGQALSTADRAILPVEFRAGSAAYVMPWPARTAGTTHDAPLQWVAKASATGVGDSNRPLLVIGQAAAWAASADLLEVPLPVVQIQPKTSHSSTDKRAVSWRDVTTEFRLLIALVLTFILTIAAWMMLRRRPRIAILIAVIACAAIPLAARQRLRPNAWSIRYEQFVDRGDGVLSHRVKTVEHAAAPLPAQPIDATLARTAVFGEETEQVTEIRTSATPIGAGIMFHPQAGWDSAERVWLRREIGTAPVIRVVSATPSRLVLDYESRIASQYAAAAWYADGKRWYGEARLPHPTKGRVTITNEVLRPGFWWSEVMWEGQRDAVRVHLLQRNDAGWTEQWWAQPYRATDFRGRQFSIDAQMVSTPDGRLTCSILVPAGTLAADARAVGMVWSDDEIATLSIATAKGTWTVEHKLLNRPRGQASRGSFEIPGEALATVREGGVIVITAVPVAPPVDRGGSASVEVTFQEKKS